MTRPLTRLIVALVLIGAGALFWKASGAADRLASDHERLATLQSAESTSGIWSAWIGRALNIGLTDEGGTVPTGLSTDYWAGRYQQVVASDAANSSSATLLLMGANAAFRRVQREAANRPPSVERLDESLQAYAGVLKNGGFNRDAAYNFEYVARLRDGVARSKGAAPARQPAPRAAARSGDDLPSGPTIHGTRGTHPPNTKGEDFEVLTPMDYGEREAQPEPTPGQPLPRKG